MCGRGLKQLLAVLLCLCGAGVCASAQTVLYVDGIASGANDGSSWSNAYTDLQATLTAASDMDEPVEIRVAQGTYSSSAPMGLRLPAGAILQGGYAGLAGTDPDDRDATNYVTVLDNGHSQALTVHDAARLVTIDGFTILHDWDVGIQIRKADVAVVACRFVSHDSYDASVEAWDANCVVSDCEFAGAGWNAILCQDGHLTLTDCTFTQKEQSAVAAWGMLEMRRCAFTDNGQAVRSLGTSVASGKLTAHDCTFTRNGRSSEPVYCDGDSTFVDCRFLYNASTSAGPGALFLNGDSATLEGCSFIGNSGPEWLGNAVQSNVDVLRVFHCLFAGNVSQGNNPGAIGHAGPIMRISNSTFVDNRGQRSIISHGPSEAIAEVTQCIVRNGSNPFRRTPIVRFSNVEGGYVGEGNFDVDPCFVVPGYWDPNGTLDDPNDDVYVAGDYHLKSQAGHWDRATESWVLDEVTSPCIDLGDPNGPLGDEPFPNGGFVNLGAYGGTAEASRSYFGGPVCETQIAGDINGDGIVDDFDLDILMSHWLMQGTTPANVPPTIRVISPEDGAELTEATPIVFRVEASDSDGSIVMVQYDLTYEGDNVRSETSIPIYDFSNGWTYEHKWEYVRFDGVYELTATAMDDAGAHTVSSTVTFTLGRADQE